MLKMAVVGMKTVTKAIENVEKQTRFAAAKTLTGAAYAARKDTMHHVGQKLTLRNRFLPQSIYVVRATKENLVARVGFLKRADWAEILEEGGTRRARRNNIAIPQGARKAVKAKIPKNLRPEALRGRKDVFRKRLGGIDGIWQLLPGRRLKLLYNLEPTTHYEARKIQFKKTASTAAMKFISRNLDKNVAHAFKTMK